MEETRALVMLGEVLGSGKDRAAAAAWLRNLAGELDAALVERRLAPFDSTRDGQLWGLLEPEADPLDPVLRAALAAGSVRMRWVCLWGEVDGGDFRHRVGETFVVMRTAMTQAGAARDRLVLLTGSAGADELLAGMAPALVDLLDGLTEHQRVVARLALLDGLRQADVAERLGIRRATVSVAFGRARVNSIARLAGTIRSICAAAAAVWAAPKPRQAVTSSATSADDVG